MFIIGIKTTGVEVDATTPFVARKGLPFQSADRDSNSRPALILFFNLLG
jgi:hypothetical protein